jgi:methanogenic corrinoid protein MtbC1
MNDVPTFLRLGIPAGVVETFAHLAFSADDSDASQLMEQMLDDGVSPESLMLDLLAPAARLLGEKWCSDEANFLEVTVGLSRIQRLMRQLRPPASGLLQERGQALLMPAPGEQHTLGLRIIEELLIRDGWCVRLMPVPDPQSAGQLVAAESYDFVGFSLSGERLIPALRQAIAAVRSQSRNRNVRIIVGGVGLDSVENTQPPLAADAVALDANEALAQARRWHASADVT